MLDELTSNGLAVGHCVLRSFVVVVICRLAWNILQGLRVLAASLFGIRGSLFLQEIGIVLALDCLLARIDVRFDAVEWLLGSDPVKGEVLRHLS